MNRAVFLEEGAGEGDSIFFCLPRLYIYLPGAAFSYTKSKASEYEQLILASTPGKSLRW